jgi:hypothetical protein
MPGNPGKGRDIGRKANRIRTPKAMQVLTLKKSTSGQIMDRFSNL